MTTKFLQLNREQRIGVLSKLQFNEQIKEIYNFLQVSYENGKDEFTIPGMLVAALLEKVYKTKDANNDFTRYVLKKYGIQNKDWIFKIKVQILGSPPYCSDKEYKIPGTSEKFVVRKDAGNRAKWTFVTPAFAWRIVVQSSSNVGRYISLLHLNVVQFLERQYLEKTMEDSFLETNKYFVFDTASDSKGMHDHVSKILAERYNGMRESQNEVGIADVESKTHVFEVKPVAEWKQGLGQVFCYSKTVGKRGILALFGEKEPPKATYSICSEANIEVQYFQCVLDRSSVVELHS